MGASGSRLQALPLNPDFQPKKKKQRTKPQQVWSQPADTSMGKHAGTQLFMLLDTLKKRNGPMSFDDLNIMTGRLLDNLDLLAQFEANPQVMKNPVNGLYSFQFEHEAVASREDLLKEIKTHSRRGGGLSVASLRSRWNGAPEVIQTLEDEGLVLVTRTTKDGVQGQPKMVFWNDIQPSEGGKPIDAEFLTMWNDLKWPGELDLDRALAQLGQTPARTSATPVKAHARNGKKKEKKAQRARHAKIQNTHLNIDLTKDYVPPGEGSGKM